MRMMMKIQCEVSAANEAIMNGKLAGLIEQQMQELKPEAAYFYVEHGMRTGFMVFDLKDVQQVPKLVEPWFMLVNAKVDVFPVMDALDLKAGLAEAMKHANLVGAKA